MSSMILQGTHHQMVEKAALLLFRSMEAFIREKGHTVLAVPGGRSVGEIFRRLSACRLEWEKVRMFMLDERLVEVDHPESNYKLVKNSMGSTIPPEAIIPFRHDPDHPLSGLTTYAEKLKTYGGCFDIVLASSGEDGHIGSLFPDHQSVRQKGDGFILLDDSPKPPRGRMSASYDLLCRSDTGILLFFGTEKRRALRNFQDDRLSYLQCPAKIVTQMSRYYVLTDQEIDSR